MKLRYRRKRLLFCLFSPALCWFCLAIRPSHAVKISVNVKRDVYVYIPLVGVCVPVRGVRGIRNLACRL